MPRAPRTKLTMKAAQLQKNLIIHKESLISFRELIQTVIEFHREEILHLEQSINEINEVVQTKGPFTKKHLNEDYVLMH